MGSWFPRVYDRFMEPLERRGLQDIRKRLLKKASGHVLEIGSGTGLNFPFYSHVETVIAIEPNAMMREKSMIRIKQAQVQIRVQEGVAELIPFPDNTFDTVVVALVLCTVAEPVKVLEEIRRVCKPNGQVLFLEHIRLSHPVLGRLQDWLTPAWRHVCDGCHLNRNTMESIKRSGFKITAMKRYYRDIFVAIEAVNKKQSLYTDSL